MSMGPMPRRVKLSLVLCLASVAVAAVFLTVTQDSWLRTVGGVLSFWLMILLDNSAHLLINELALEWRK